MPNQYPNANYPQAYVEADMVKATSISTNEDGGKLTVTEVGAGEGPLTEHEGAMTGADVKGVTLNDAQPSVVPESPATEDE